jgi:hypothetical protein
MTIREDSAASPGNNGRKPRKPEKTQEFPPR